MSDRLLDIKDLNVSIKNQKKIIPVLNKVTFSVKKGESIGIIGQSGAGKSMTMYAITDLLPPSASVTGSIVFYGKDDILQMKAKDRRRYCSKNAAIILQDSINALTPYKKIYDQLEETVIFHHGFSKSEAKDRIYEMMKLFSIDTDTLGKYPHQFSGGMRQRIAIAMALESDADLLIADEPTTSLDVISQMKFIRFIEKIREEKEITLLYISHNLGLVDMLCDYAYVMKNGEVVEHGTTKEIFSAPKNEYTKEMVNGTKELVSDKKI